MTKRLAANALASCSQPDTIVHCSLIIGTLDGANIEIGQEIGFDNMFIFGAKTEDVPQLRQERSELQVTDA